MATKWGHDVSLAEGERGGDPAQIRARLEASLNRLGTEYVDHYQLHRPDPETPAAETLGCLAELRAEGKIREIGCTHFTAAELDDSAAAAADNGLAPYPSVQNYYSLLTRGPEDDGVFAACERHGIAFVPYFPLESGLLTGKYQLGKQRPADSRLVKWGDRADRFIDDDKLATVARLTDWAESNGHSILELAMSWHTSHPLVASVIAGATATEQEVGRIYARCVIEEECVGAESAEKLILVSRAAADQRIVAGSAIKAMGAAARDDQCVVTITAIDSIVPGARVDNVDHAGSRDRLVAA